MVRHSKNNTASSAFTKAEYGKLRDVWGSQSARLGAESMKHFDQCNLCLNTVESPVACTLGHLFCKECILSSLLEQKREMVTVQATLARLEQEHERERQQARAEAKTRVQRDFERIQAGVGGKSTSSSSSTDQQRRRDRRSATPPTRSQRSRSRSPDRASGALADLPARIAAQTERVIAQTMLQLEKEHAQAKRDKIPAYWLPSLTPSADARTQDVVRRTEDVLAQGMITKCFVADKHGHATGIKSLIELNFITSEPAQSHTADTSPDRPRKICPSCKKTLSDVHRLLIVRKCGHVHCATCVDTLLRPAFKLSKGDKEQRPSCLECGVVIKCEERDLISLQREGTGFSSAGNHETKQSGISFQG